MTVANAIDSFAPALRAVLAILSVLAGIVGCVAVLGATDGPHRASVFVAFAMLILGFVGLGVTRQHHARWRPLRLSLSAAALVAAYMAFSLPWPPRGTDLGSMLLLAASIAVSIVIAIVPNRFPRVALALLVILGAYGVFILSRFSRAVVGAKVESYSGPAIVLSFTIAACVGAAWLAALWHGRFLLQGSLDDDRDDAA